MNKLRSKRLILSLLLTFNLFCSPETSKAYPPYTASSDLVISGPYDTATSGSGNWGSSSVTLRDFIAIGQKYRIRKTGTIERIRMYTDSTQDLTGFYLMIWRQNGSNYDLVGTSENLASNLSSGSYSTITLSSPITGVQEGDFYGGRMQWTSPHNSFYARTGVSGVTSYFYNGQASTTNFAWESKTSTAGSVMPIEIYMSAPQAVFIGDSIIMGATDHTSYLTTTLESSTSTTIEGHLHDLTGYSYQNMGIGSQKTSDILARISSDVVALKPQIVVINGGVNDIAGSISKSTFIANWTSILDTFQSDSNIKKVIVLKILPWTNGTNTQMQTRDDWNASLATLASNYSKALVVDADSYVGQFRAGGDSNNLWDINPSYNSDGVHFNSSGHLQIATAIKNALDSLPAKVLSFSPTNGQAAVAVNSNLVINFDNIVDSQSGNDNDIQIINSADNSVVETIDAQSSKVSGSGSSSITINPDINLNTDSSYHILIGANAFKGSGAANYAGISSGSTWSFDTVDTIRPVVSSYYPSNASTSVSISSNLSITFDKIVTASSGINNDITIRKLSDDTVFETIDIQSANITGSGTNTITINPTSNFDINTAYYVTIDSGALVDQSGNYFLGVNNNTTWSFRTINYVGSYQYRKSITISNTNISSTLTDFPLYIKITNDSNIGSAARNDGHDILFTDSSNSPLPYERESWSGGGGSSANGSFWVKTTLNADNNTSTNDTIYVYYGYSNSTDNQDVADGNNDVWNSNFAGVWHLAESATDEQVVSNKHIDSTINAKYGNQNGNAQTTGKISYGQAFDGVDDNVTMSSAAYSSRDITVTWWSKCGVVTPTAEGLFDINRGATDRLFGYHWSIGGQNGIYIDYRDTSASTHNVRILDSSITQSDWHYFAAIWNETARTLTIYKDGIAQSASMVSSPTIPSGTDTRIGIGAVANEGNVSIDEFRISSTSLSSAWIRFEYENMSSATNELTFGSQTANTSSDDITAPQNPSSPSFGTVTSSSIEIIKPDTVTETESGLYKWQARRDSATLLGYQAIASTSITDTGLSPNTSYSYDANFMDQTFNLGSYSNQVSKYTLADKPTALAISVSGDNVTVSSNALPNDSSGSSGYYFTRTGDYNSGWIHSNTWTFSNIPCNQNIEYKVKFRNAEGVETDYYNTYRQSSECPRSGSTSRVIINKNLFTLPPQLASPKSNTSFSKPIPFGSRSKEVIELQTLLATMPDIYPEKIISGYYGKLTENAIKKLQIKYNVVKSTNDPAYGYMGPKTRALINQLINKNESR